MLALGIDPDLHHAGLALVRYDPILRQQPNVVWLGVALAPKKLKSYAAASALEWPDPFPRAPDRTIDVLVVEGQRIYPHSPVDPADLMHLAFAAGLALGHYRDHAAAVKVPEPAQWKGTVPKKIAQGRILSRVIIMPEAAEAVGSAHASHVTDAIWLALYGLGLDGATKFRG